MKKKLQKKTDPEVLNGYLTYMDYCATGEGRTIQFNFCYAEKPEDALQKHLDRFFPNDQPAQNYFSVGVDIMLIESKEAKDLLKAFFFDGVHKPLKEAGTEFHFCFHWNYS